MIIMADTRKDAARIGRAMLAMTGYQPTTFKLADGYRVQENEYGNHWGEALQALLADGAPPSACTRSAVAAKVVELGL